MTMLPEPKMLPWTDKVVEGVEEAMPTYPLPESTNKVGVVEVPTLK